jgi:hypothetical protein
VNDAANTPSDSHGKARSDVPPDVVGHLPVSPPCRPVSSSKNSRYSSRPIVVLSLTTTQVLESIYADELLSLYITSAIAPFAKVPYKSCPRMK